MWIDPKIEEAVRIAVNQAGQKESLARKIIAWMQAVISGNEDVNDVQAAQRHLELLYSETKVSSDVVQEQAS